MRLAAYGLDHDLLARDEVEHVEPPAGLVLDRVVEVEPVDGEEELVAAPRARARANPGRCTA